MNQLQEELKAERGRLQETSKNLQSSKQLASELHEQLEQANKENRESSKKVMSQLVSVI